jgi:hypothetical protein
MPNPFRYKGADFVAHPNALLLRPHLTAKISLIAAHWESAEDILADIFVYLLGGKNDVALDIFNNIIERNLRKEAVRILAEKTIPGDLQTRILGVIEKGRRIGGRRHDVVHGRWTTVPSRPHSLMLIDKSEQARFRHKNLSNILTGPQPDSVPEWTFIEYKAGDFDTIIKDIISYRSKLINLSVEVLTHILQITIGERQRRTNLLLFQKSISMPQADNQTIQES